MGKVFGFSQRKDSERQFVTAAAAVRQFLLRESAEAVGLYQLQ